jgi:hypothetical protein
MGAVESYKQAKAEADRTSGTANYEYVHAHFRIGLHQGCIPPVWARGAKGFCIGQFKHGSEPFDNTDGETWWEKVGGDTPRALRVIPGVGKSGIVISQLASNWKIECLIADRSKGDCYTKASQQGKPPNSVGGPLYLDAEFGRYRYVLLRGWCEKGDRLCTPH